MKWSNLDLVHYETRVFVKANGGRWANYDELEESLTLNELFALYGEAVDSEVRNFKALARAQGADVELEFGPPTGSVSSESEDAFEGLMSRISEKVKTQEPTEEEKIKTNFRKMKMGYNKK